MMAPGEKDAAADGELVEPRPVADPIRMAFGAAIEAVMDMLPDGFAREAPVREIMRAEERTKAALVRRVLN
jgi:hypothetical protein